ncbi:hypothetical protein KIPB_005261 [Kipferlia bialata]|uniref:Uncharacterized protein n=1 Tax=Kipferlia bialata TaxID=797122 RepID=A0A9K3GIS4_9EUKA|nr:hypothetical protein KIPB_005261 [Kipferlia bialata]|eukprot:g5261.t1
MNRSTLARDTILQSKTLKEGLLQFTREARGGHYESEAIHTLYSLILGLPRPVLSDVKEVLPIVADYLDTPREGWDLRKLIAAVHIYSIIGTEPDYYCPYKKSSYLAESSQDVVDTGLIPRLMELSFHTRPIIWESALDIVYNTSRSIPGILDDQDVPTFCKAMMDRLEDPATEGERLAKDWSSVATLANDCLIGETRVSETNTQRAVDSGDESYDDYAQFQEDATWFLEHILSVVEEYSVDNTFRQDDREWLLRHMD